MRSGNPSLDPRKPVDILADLIDANEFDVDTFTAQTFVTSFVYPQHHHSLLYTTVESLTLSEAVLSTMTHFKWTFLHYACRFCSDMLN